MGRLVLRLLVVAGLAVDAYVHWDLAAAFDPVVGNGDPQIRMGDLFRLEAALAVVALLIVLVRPRRWSFGLAFLVAAGGLAAVLVYSWTGLGAVGPLPDMHDPTWSTEKIVSAVSQAVAAVAALLLLGRGAPPRSRVADPEQSAAGGSRGTVRTAPAGPEDRPASPREPLNPA